MTLSDRDMLIYAVLGFGTWLSGAFEVFYVGRFLFESGVLVSALSAIFIAVAVCLVFRATMRWRRTGADMAVTVATLMVLPGLFGEAARQLLFGLTTGLQPSTEKVFAATIFFGNAVLLSYAVFLQRRAALK